ncbi:MAG: pantoate--beta-alanine ligase [Bacteroidales bacterium]|nr:pantoate--beta-alanine ligase [Bacteroidales bacterium]
MEIIQLADLLSQKVRSYRNTGRTVGFVPTMGALHGGHLSLLDACKAQNDVSIVSIFVNPTQFNDPADLCNYPRNLSKDLELLEKNSCDLAFCPDEKEIYPVPDTRQFNFGGLDNVMEGLRRPGHFNGVAQVVTRLLDIVIPHRIYFGLKDFQQVAIIRKVVDDLKYPIEIVACPIVREDDGLALSSRNVLLSPEQRASAVAISRILFAARDMAKVHTADETREFVVSRINSNPLMEADYFEIVDDRTLQPVKDFGQKGNKIGCIAVKLGKIRLIDNVYFSS